MVVEKIHSATKKFLKEAFKNGIHDYIAWGIRAGLIIATIYLFNIVKYVPTYISNVKRLPELENRVRIIEQRYRDKHLLDSLRLVLKNRTDENEKRLK